MAFNGSGVFQRVYNWTIDAAGGIKILAARMDGEDNGFATGLSNTICRDGQSTIIANLPMSGYKHTNVANGSASNDYAALGQLQSGSVQFVAAGGTADALTANFTPAITSLVDGQQIRVRAASANATTTPTLSVNGLTARTITKNGGTALVAGDILNSAHELLLRYNLANTRWELLNAGYNVPAPSAAFKVLSTNSGANGYETVYGINQSLQTVDNPTFATVTLPHGSAPGSPTNGQLWTTTAALFARINGVSKQIPSSAYTIQTFTSGSGTYTTPAGVSRIRVRIVGGGGGGGGGGGAGGAGGTTTFGSSLLTANGGSGGSGNAPGASGGSASVAGGALGIGVTGGSGGGAGNPGGTAVGIPGGVGGSSAFGGGGAGGSTVPNAGGAGVTNTGGGGGGGGCNNAGASTSAGSGGGSGGYVDATIVSPSATYSYAVGASGSAGASGGTGGSGGGAGGSGIIIVEEFY